MTIYAWVAYILVLIGGINLGFVGLFGVSIVTSLLGNFLGRIVFILIGVAAGYLIYLLYLEKAAKTPPAPPAA